MKKIVLNISDIEYEKFRFEAIHERKSVPDVIKDRLFMKAFHEDVEEAYNSWLEEQLTQIMNEEI